MNNEQQTLVLTRGLPASGKSTWAKKWLSESSLTRTRVNRDNLRYETYGSYWFGTGDKASRMEDNITKIQHGKIREALKAGFSVVVDDTNLNLNSLQQLVDIAKEFKGKVQLRIEDFPVEIDELIRRDANRINQGQRGVGSDVIRMFAERNLRGGNFPKLPDSYYRPIKQ